MIRDFATAGASAGASGGALSMARGDAPRRADSVTPSSPVVALARVAYGSPGGPIGVRLYWAMCWIIFTGTALQWLAAH